MNLTTATTIDLSLSTSEIIRHAEWAEGERARARTARAIYARHPGAFVNTAGDVEIVKVAKSGATFTFTFQVDGKVTLRHSRDGYHHLNDTHEAITMIRDIRLGHY